MSSASGSSIDLSGTWRLNLAESSFGGEQPEQDYELTWRLEQSPGGIRIAESAQNVSIVNIPLPNSSHTTEYNSDGRESVILRPGPNILPGLGWRPQAPQVRFGVKAEWQGRTFWIEERTFPDSSYSVTHRRIFLSNDGMRLIELLHITSLTDDTEQKLVFERVP
jgi:hypothetical protein